MSQASSAAQWHYTDASRQQQGPFSREQMLALARAGTVGPATLVWSAGMAGWLPFAQSPLASQARPGAPPRGGPPPVSPVSPDSFQGAVRACFERYATFAGRARRPEFWYFVLFTILVGIAASIVDMILFRGMMMNASPINALFNLAVLVPSLAVGARRLHDTDRSGWWQLLWFVPVLGWIALIVFYCQRGTEGANRFG